jgi:endonuclease/exonuclease/phosphatase family metal-dependent hydrolase
VPAAIWAAVRTIDPDLGFPWVALIAYTPYMAAASVLPVGVALLAHRWVALVVALAAMVSLGAAVVPRTFSSQQAPPADGVSLRVMSANLKLGTADLETVAGLAREHNVDVLSIQELTPRSARGLKEAGLDEVLPHHLLSVAPGSAGAGLYASDGLRRVSPGSLGPSPMRLPRAIVKVPGARVEAVVVHPNPPTDGDSTERWESILADLPQPDTDRPPRILAGDFNATLDHSQFHELLDAGYVDAGAAAGAGLEGTWSSGRTGLPVTIDHVLVDERIGVGDVEVLELPGSDHNAVVAELTVPPTD